MLNITRHTNVRKEIKTVDKNNSPNGYKDKDINSRHENNLHKCDQILAKSILHKQKYYQKLLVEVEKTPRPLSITFGSYFLCQTFNSPFVYLFAALASYFRADHFILRLSIPLRSYFGAEHLILHPLASYFRA